jgi:hypothetical protein
MDRKNIDYLLLNWQDEKFDVKQITDPDDTEENKKRAQAFVTKFNNLMDTLDYPGTSAMPFLAPTKNILPLLKYHFQNKREFDTEQYLQNISSAHRKKRQFVDDEERKVVGLHDRAREGDEKARHELVRMDQNNPIEIDNGDGIEISDEYRQMAREAGLDPDSLVLNRGDIYALSFPRDTKKCGVFRLSRQKGRKLRKNVIEMYDLAGLPELDKWVEFAKRNEATPNQFHQTMMSLTRMRVSMRVYSRGWTKNKAWEFILGVRYRTHQEFGFVRIDGLRDGYAEAKDRTFEGWANFQCEPFQVDVKDLVLAHNEIKSAAPNLKDEKQDVLKRIFVPLNEMWNRIRRMGLKNTAQWMEQSKTRQTHKTWVKIGNNKGRVSKAFEDVPEDFQQDLHHSQATCRKGRQQQKFDQLRGSLQRLHDRGVRMAQIRDWLFEPQDVNQMDDDDQKVVVRLRSNFRRFKPQTDEKLKRRMIRLGLPEFRARQIENVDQDPSVDPFRLGKRRKRKPKKTEQLQVQGSTTKLKPLEVHSNKWKGTTDKWLQIPLLKLSKTFLSKKVGSGS